MSDTPPTRRMLIGDPRALKHASHADLALRDDMTYTAHYAKRRGVRITFHLTQAQLESLARACHVKLHELDKMKQFMGYPVEVISQ